MRIPIFILVSITFGCTPVRVVDFQKKTEFDLSAYKTYFYFNIEEPEQKGKYFDENLVLLKRAIDSEMAKKGYTFQESGGDLLINIGISVEEKVQTRETDFRTDGIQYMGQRNYQWQSQEVEVDRYKEGTIVLDFIDPIKRQLVWQGSVAGTTTDSRKKIEARINTAINNLFKKFPVK
jgi:uncharacterized protein YdeI (BOF family)